MSKKGVKKSAEVKRKMSDGQKKRFLERPVSDETRKKMSFGQKKRTTGYEKRNAGGWKHTPETLKKFKERVYPPEMFKKIADAHRGSKSHFWVDGRMGDKKYVSWMKNKRNRLKKVTCKELGSHTYGDWELLKKQYNFTCPCCNQSEPEIKLTEDHIIPLSKGGSDLIENIQPLCHHCNVTKHTDTIKY